MVTVLDDFSVFVKETHKILINNDKNYEICHNVYSFFKTHIIYIFNVMTVFYCYSFSVFKLKII
jgi:hypothetical protein